MTQEGLLAHNVMAATGEGGRQVLLKRYDLTDKELRRTLRRELGIALGVQHPCVLPVTAAFASQEDVGLMGYTEMPRYPHTLTTWLQVERPTLHAAIAILRQVSVLHRYHPSAKNSSTVPAST